MLDKSARESLQTFTSGKGDVLLAYENEAILAQQKGEDIDYVVPDQTILIENPVAVVNESKSPDKAKAFVDFLYTPEAQEIFAEQGLPAGRRRAPRPTRTSRPRPSLFDITKFGGWADGQRQVLRPGEGRDRRDLPVAGEEHCLRLAKQPPHLRPRRPRAAVEGVPSTGDVLGRGIAMAYLSIVALIPLAAVVAKSLDGGLDAFWDAITQPAGGRGAASSR